VTDIRINKIPNVLTMPAILCAIVLHSFDKGLNGFLFSTVGIITGFGLLFIFYLMGGMGAGDVKLMGAVGGFIGPQATFEAFLLIALIGGIYSVAVIVTRREMFKGFFSEKIILLSSVVMLKQYIPLQTGIFGQRSHLKYGVAIALGTITYLILRQFEVKILF
jgi:prepilin peptidase CpaA